MSKTTNKFSPEVRERAVRMVVEQRAEYGSEWEVMKSIAAKIGNLHAAWRNKKTQTSTLLSLYADDGSTVITKSTTSDDGTTLTVGEFVSGP